MRPLIAILIFNSFLGASVSAGAAENFVAPVPVALSGIEPIFGLAAGSQPYEDSSFRILGGAVTGGVKAWGLGLVGIPLPNETGKIHVGLGQVQSAVMKVDYSRGLSRGREYSQELSGQVVATSWEESWNGPELKSNIGFILSEVRIRDYEFNRASVSRPSTGGYFPIRTNSFFAELNWDQRSPDQREGFRLSINMTTLQGRTGQSDTLVFSETASVLYPAQDSIVIAASLTLSDSVVVKEQSQYTERNQVLAALDTRCGLESDLARRQTCEQLETEVADQIVASNKYGTARPLGGARGFRAAHEQRYRSAHTRLASLEIRYRAPIWNLQFVPFLDVGGSSDESAKSFQQSRSATGAELRLPIKEIPLRLGYAKSSDEEAVYFTAGLAF